MITEQNKDNLYRITSNLSFKDYEQAKEKFGKISFNSRKKFTYNLSDMTIEALDYYKIACKHDITQEEIETVKAYLLKIRFAYPELWEETNPNYEQWKSAKIRVM